MTDEPETDAEADDESTTELRARPPEDERDDEDIGLAIDHPTTDADPGGDGDDA